MANETPDQISFLIREEELDIKKKWVQIGEINCHKEVLVEDINITVPVVREEFVIEKRFTDPESPDQLNRTETIRIPLREEQIEIKIQPFDLEEVEIYKQQLHQMKSVNEALKKEVVIMETRGNVDLELDDQ